MKRKAIIMGATSGIGREVAKLLLNKGWEIGITGRRKEELIKFQQKAPDLIHFKAIDVCKDDAPILLLELIDEMGGIDLYVHSSGYGKQNINRDLCKTSPHSLSFLFLSSIGSPAVYIFDF